MEKDSLYDEKRKFFLRFLKEKNIYCKYKKYIHNKKYYNVYQRDNNNWSFDGAAIRYGMHSMISTLICWNSTPEGYKYWDKLHNEFINEYSKKFGDVYDL